MALQRHQTALASSLKQAALCSLNSLKVEKALICIQYRCYAVVAPLESIAKSTLLPEVPGVGNFASSEMRRSTLLLSPLKFFPNLNLRPPMHPC